LKKVTKKEKEMEKQKILLMFGASGPALVMTKHDFTQHPEMLEKLADKTTGKFVAFELDPDSIARQYKEHFSHLPSDPKQTSDIKILDDDGDEIFANIKFDNLSNPIFYDPEVSKMRKPEKMKV
jgi:hypothetical protein